MLDSPAITTALLGIITSIVVGLIKMGSDKIDGLSMLAKQIVVLVVATVLVVANHYFDILTVPQVYRDSLGTVLQTIVVTLAAIGSHNIKEGVKVTMGGGES